MANIIRISVFIPLIEEIVSLMNSLGIEYIREDGFVGDLWGRFLLVPEDINLLHLNLEKEKFIFEQHNGEYFIARYRSPETELYGAFHL